MCFDNLTSNWKELYIAAILEIDSTKISSRIRDAKMAICDRVEELNGGGNATERMALNRAMKALNDLQDVYFRESRKGPPLRFEPQSVQPRKSHPTQDAA